MEITKVAKIARIQLDESEQKKLEAQLNNILEWSQQLDGTGETGYFTDKVNVFRDDKIESFKDVDLIKANFKQVKKGKLIVPRGL